MGTSLQMEGMVTVTCDCAGDQNRRGARTELFRRRLCTFQWHLKMGPKWRAWRCHRCARGWCLELIGRAARLSGEGGVGKGRRPSLFKRWMRLSKVSVCARVHESLCMCMRIQLLKNESVSPCVKVYFRHEQHSNLRNTQATTKMARQTMFSAAGACLSLCATAHTHYAYRLNILNPLIKCVFMVCMHACVCVCTWGKQQTWQRRRQRIRDAVSIFSIIFTRSQQQASVRIAQTAREGKRGSLFLPRLNSSLCPHKLGSNVQASHSTCDGHPR